MTNFTTSWKDGKAFAALAHYHVPSAFAWDDVEGMTGALQDLAARHANGGLPAVELADDLRDRLSRRARAEETAELLREIAG